MGSGRPEESSQFPCSSIALPVARPATRMTFTSRATDMKKTKGSKHGNVARVIAAAQFAAFKHREQRRKGADKSPYINHPLALAGTLAVDAGVEDVEVVMAAILHDTIEDTKTTQAELEQHFGRTVASVVAEVTDEKGQSKRLRKYLQVTHAPGLSERAKLVKLADKISNLRDIIARPPAGWDMKRKQEYFDWAKRVVDGLRGIHPQLEAEFDRVYAMKPGSAPAKAARSRPRGALAAKA
jgi:guanosine-3',5'-bis(diphosphate) 3'-pyrophosphohydrolase